MAREQFKFWKPHAATLKVVEQANVIIEEFQAQGFTLTLRQLFYQFVARALIENTFNEYKRLGGIVSNGRDSGMIDWNAIEDRTREVNTHAAWDDAAHIVAASAGDFQVDLWEGQHYRPEVWIEKDALLGVIEGVCTEFRVPYFAHRGNNSQTAQHEAGKQFGRQMLIGLEPIVLHLADHDPNGIDMTRDNHDRLEMYADGEVEVRRIALNLDQVRRYRPPPNFVKETDSRTGGYREQFGTDECWELDALSPTVISDLIRAEIEGLIDYRIWRSALAREKRERDMLYKAAQNWTKVEKMLAKERR